MKISEIDAGEENLFIIAQVLSIDPTEHKGKKYLRCVLGDDTGTVDASLHENPILAVGGVYEFWSSIAAVHKQHIIINTSRPNSIHKSTVQFGSIRLEAEYNISKKFYVPDD